MRRLKKFAEGADKQKGTCYKAKNRLYKRAQTKIYGALVK